MKRTRLVTTTAAMLLAVAAGSGFAADPEIPAAGPMPFESMDSDHNGFASQEEYRHAQSVRLQQRSEEQARYQYRNMDKAPGYADIDPDHTGRVSREGFQAHPQQRQQEREERHQQHMLLQQERMQQPGGGMRPGGGMNPGGGMGGGKH